MISLPRPAAPSRLHAAGLVLLAWAAASCVGDPEEKPPVGPEVSGARLVLLYATCTLNRHFLSPYDSGVAFTPRLAELARESVVFRRHQTESGQSGTAFASIFSGAQAETHGVFRHPTQLDESVELIGEAFRRDGWDVATWLDHGMASGELGYAQGADPGNVHDRKLAAGDPALARILERLRRDPDYKVLLVTNFTVTHGPYQLATVEPFCRLYPDQCPDDREAFLRYVDFYRRAHAFLSYDFPATREKTAMDDAHLAGLRAAVELLYRAGIAYLDDLFGALADEIRGAGLWDESVIAFTADHGETLFREGTYFKWTHGHQLAPEVLGVPLVLRAPGVEPGVWEGVTRSIDLFPTLAGLAGIEMPAAEGSGLDLSAALRGLAPEPEIRAYSHTALVAEPVLEASRKWSLFHALYPRVDPELMWVQVRDGDRVHQLRRTPAGEPEPAVFDLAADPHELDNLFEADDGEHAQVLTDLRHYRQRLIEAYREHAARGGELDLERQEELLKSLSYID